MVRKVFIVSLLSFFSFGTATAQTSQHKADSLLHTLSLDEKIGQLFMVPVYIGSDRRYMNEIEDVIKSHQVGGIVVMDGSISGVAQATRQAQQLSNIPLFIGIDGTNGWTGRIDSAASFPGNVTLAASRNDASTYAVGKEVARQLKILGINLHFGPAGSLLDPNDPNPESFSSDKKLVASKAVAYMRGLQDQGIIAIAKGFPIQGITIRETKKGELPSIQAYIDSVAIYPYRQLFMRGANGMLPASSEFPLFYEKKKNIKRNPYSTQLLTSIYAGEWVRKELNYDELVFVSIPQIRGQTNSFADGEAELLAFQAGNDIILLPEEIGPSIRKIKRLIRKDAKYEQQLDASVRKILQAKYDHNLFTPPAPVPDRLYSTLNPVEAKVLRTTLLDEAITLVSNAKSIVPIQTLEDRHFLAFTVGVSALNSFTDQLNKYVHATRLSGAALSEQLRMEIDHHDVIIVGIHHPPSATELELIRWLIQLQSTKQVVFCSFLQPTEIPLPDELETLLVTYEGSELAQSLMAQKLFGALSSKGQLPVPLSSALKAGTGVTSPGLQRFQYSFPEDAGVDSRALERIDEIAREAIAYRATPGCVVLVARNGKVIYEKAFGYQTYDSTLAVTDSTLYDLASVTKVSATLQTVMFMHDRGLIDINRKLSYYLPELKNSNKKDFTIKDILTHQAGLWPYLPFWTQTMKDSLHLPEYYSQQQDDRYPFQVADKLYATATMRDSLWQWIIKSKIRDKPDRTPFDYRYSDMGFYMMQHLAEKLLNQPIEDFLRQNLYEPLGSFSTGFLPLSRFPTRQIAPTEADKLFRKTLLVGTVHDQGAAMHGGVAGHAGLFSNANDLAKLGQMMLQEGRYGGIQYYRPETVRLFIGKQFESSRRGLGWDKPVQSDWNSPTSLSASPKTFGHTGFTGTCIWVDPEFDLVYVFLSNRVNPDMNNNKLLSMNIRSRIQDAIYQAIFSYCGNPVASGVEESFNLTANKDSY